MPTILKPGFHMIVGDRSRSLGSLVKCSAIVTIIWKPNFHFSSNRQWSQRLPTITTVTIAGIESESISAIIAIVNNRQRSQKVNGNHKCHMKPYESHSTAIATIMPITAIICVLRSEWSQWLYGNQTSAIVTIAEIECFQWSQWSQRL